MKDETPRLFADGVKFETSPDPLLTEHVAGPDLYAPGSLLAFGGRAGRPDLHGGFGSSGAGFAAELGRGLAEGDLERGLADRMAALRAHPSGHTYPAWGSGAGDATRTGVSSDHSKRYLAIFLALMFGSLGAHNWLLGKPHRAAVNIIVWVAGLLATSATGLIFMMLPIVALVLVESVQIYRGTGEYAYIR